MKSQRSSVFPWTKEMSAISSGWRRAWRRTEGGAFVSPDGCHPPAALHSGDGEPLSVSRHLWILCLCQRGSAKELERPKV